MALDWDLYIQVVGMLLASVVSVYCFRLSKFFRDGVFYESFRLLAPAFAVYAFGSLIDTLPHLGLLPEDFHLVHFVAYTVFFGLTVRSIYLFYRAWKTMGMDTI